jgi:hypothetical protein
MTIAETANLHQADGAVKPGVEAQECFGLACVLTRHVRQR